MESLPTFLDVQPSEIESALVLAFGHLGISLFGIAHPHALACVLSQLKKFKRSFAGAHDSMWVIHILINMLRFGSFQQKMVVVAALLRGSTFSETCRCSLQTLLLWEFFVVSRCVLV